LRASRPYAFFVPFVVNFLEFVLPVLRVLRDLRGESPNFCALCVRCD
jgi:hypothetical protein